MITRFIVRIFVRIHCELIELNAKIKRRQRLVPKYKPKMKMKISIKNTLEWLQLLGQQHRLFVIDYCIMS